MSYTDDLQALINYIDYIESGVDSEKLTFSYVDIRKFGELATMVESILLSLLDLMTNVLTNGEPYPPSKLSLDHSFSEILDTGDGSPGPFSGITTYPKVIPGTVNISAVGTSRALYAKDNGFGVLTGDVDPTTSNTFNYDTGVWQCTFIENVQNLSDIFGVYTHTKLSSVLVGLHWAKASGNVDGHRVYRRLPPGGYAQIGSDLGPSVEVYDDAAIVPGNIYYYKVTGFNTVSNPKLSRVEWRSSYASALAWPDDIVASIPATILLVASLPGRVKRAGLYLENSGQDGVNPLELELDIKNGANSIFSVKPKITDVAPDQSNTFASGVSGVTEGSVDDSFTLFARADLLLLDLTLTRTPTPVDEMAGALVIIEFEEGSPSESDDSNELEVAVPL